MLHKIIWFWNLVHYNIFIWENNFTYFLLKPFFKLLNSSKSRAFYEKRGVTDPESIVKNALINKDNSSNSVRAGGIMGVLLLFICISITLIYTGLYANKLDIGITHLLVYGVIISLVNYSFLFKERKYLLYFDEFSKYSKNDSKRYSLLSLAFIVLVVFFLIGSFMFMDSMLNKEVVY